MDTNSSAYVPYVEEKGGEFFGQHTTDGFDQVAVPSGTAAMGDFGASPGAPADPSIQGEDDDGAGKQETEVCSISVRPQNVPLSNSPQEISRSGGALLRSNAGISPMLSPTSGGGITGSPFRSPNQTRTFRSLLRSIVQAGAAAGQHHQVVLAACAQSSGGDQRARASVGSGFECGKGDVHQSGAPLRDAVADLSVHPSFVGVGGRALGADYFNCRDSVNMQLGDQRARASVGSGFECGNGGVRQGGAFLRDSIIDSRVRRSLAGAERTPLAASGRAAPSARAGTFAGRSCGGGAQHLDLDGDHAFFPANGRENVKQPESCPSPSSFSPPPSPPPLNGGGGRGSDGGGDGGGRDSALIQALVEGLARVVEGGSSGKVGAVQHPSFDWMFPSSSTASTTLFSHQGNTFNLDSLFHSVPDPQDKAAYDLFYKGYDAPLLLKPFCDGLSDTRYMLLRHSLSEALWLLTCTKPTASRGEGEALAVVLRSVRMHTSGTSPHSSSYLTLRAAYVHFSSAKHGTSRSAVSGMFAFMGSLDRFFLSSSRSAAKRGWEAEIEQLTIQNSYTPSSALASIYDLCSRRFDEERAWEETVDHFRTLLEAQHRLHPFLASFVDLVSTNEFETRAYTFWHDKLRSHEANSSSATALRSALAAVAASPRVPPMPRGVRSNPSSTTPSQPLLASVVEDRSAGAATGSVPRRGPLPGMGEDWVKVNGVPGYPAPNNPERPPLNVRQVYAAMGFSGTELEGLPTARGTPVGPNCPACRKERDIPQDGWYVHEMDTVHFAGVGQKRIRPRDASTGRYMAKTAFYHNGAKCSSLYALVHKFVRAHPDMTHLFDPNPPGTDPYAS